MNLLRFLAELFLGMPPHYGERFYFISSTDFGPTYTGPRVAVFSKKNSAGSPMRVESPYFNTDEEAYAWGVERGYFEKESGR